MINWFLNLFQDRNFGATRDSRWPSVRKNYLNQNPKCAICGKKGLLRSNEIHHVVPVHIDDSKELNPQNFTTLCRTHHFELGHFFNFKSYNLEIKEWALKIKNRP